jgi:Ca-activated chloride channel family protein
MIEFVLSLGFGQPWWLLLLPLVPLVAWMYGKQGRAPAVRYSGLGTLRGLALPPRRDPGAWTRRFLLVALGLCVVGMARPRRDLGQSPDRREGVDLVFCVDMSGSMDRKDFPKGTEMISKREAVVTALSDFVDRRPNDRFGMVGFASDTYLLSPLTTDGEWIKAVLKQVRLKPRTAIGEGIVSSTRLLKDTEAKSKVIIVLSDGANNYGISPLEATDAAAAEGMRVYAVQFMRPTDVSVRKADSLMGQIAERGRGIFFQASNLDTMVSVFREIDKLEKSKFEQNRARLYDELYPWVVLAAFGMLLGGWVGGNTLWLKIP